MYQLTNNGVIRQSDSAFIPADPLNADYQAFLAWQAEGNTPEPVAAPTLADLKTAKLTDINAECDRRINAEVLSYPATEVLTFPKQETEARAWAAGNTAATPLIDALAENRGIDKAELVSRIVAKADYFAAFTGKMVGYRQKLEDQVSAATTLEELAAIDPLAGWPE